MLGGRFSLERPLLSSESQQRWMAIEASSGRLVVVALAEPGRLSTFGKGVTHRHLVGILDVVKEVDPKCFPPEVKLPLGAGFAVAEHLPGRSLRSLIEAGPLHPAKAVAWILRLADAVQALHAAGAVHGAISPRSVVAVPEGRAIAPVLSQLIAPAVGAFVPPERLRGAPESAADDVWALCATLYTMLTGKLPFPASTRDGLLKAMIGKPEPLFSSGLTEPVLQEIIARGLLGERRQRAIDLNELQALLDNWEREPTKMPPPRPPPRAAPRGLGDIVAGTAFGTGRDDGLLIDDAALPDDQGAPDKSRPAQVRLPPESVAPVVPVGAPLGQLEPEAVAQGMPLLAAPVRAMPRRVSFNPFERKVSVWPWVLVAALAGGGGVYVTLAPSSKPDLPPPPPSADVLPAAAPKPVLKRNADVVRNECVAQHFPSGSFDANTDFAFVCEDAEFAPTVRHLFSLSHDPNAAADAGAAAGGGKLHDAGMPVEVVRLSGGRQSDGGVRGSGLDWYELPATAIIRKTCCPNSSPVILPELSGWCEQLQSVVRRMADDSAKSVDLGPGARSFDRAVGCLFAGHVKHGYSYLTAPSPASRAVFQQFLSRAAIVSTRR
jgi:serine/threonine protein kinase